MRSLLRVARWEWFKLRRRRMPWVLLLLLVVVSQAVIWGAFAAAQRLQGAGSIVGPLGGLRLTDAFTLPGSIAVTMIPIRQVAILFLALVTATVVGSDYALGTYRPIVAGGTPRWAALGGKLVVVAGASLAAFVVLTAGIALSSMAAAVLSGLPPTPPAPWDQWVESGRILATTWSGLVPFLMLTTLVTVLTRSTTAAIAIVVGYTVLEPLFVAFLLGAGGLFADAAPYLPMRLLAVWNGPPSLPFVGVAEVASVAQAAVGLTAYALVLAAA